MPIKSKPNRGKEIVLALCNRKVPVFASLPPDVRERLAPYRSTKTSSTLAFWCWHEPDTVDFVLKFYPELSDIDWENVDSAWAKETWMQPVIALQSRCLWTAEHCFDWDRPYKEIAKLPRKEFARAILKMDEEDSLIRAHFDLDQMELWAGYRKPEVTCEGNVFRIGR